MTIVVRRLDDQDAARAMHTFTRAMHFGPLTGEDWELAKARSYPDRSFGAFDGATMVGHTRSYPFRTLVPGGALVATAGVSAVGTLPTHRRRGILTQLMHTQLSAFHEAGEILASLRASEAGIYGRFGYGLAAHAASVEVSTRKGGLRERLPDDGSFEYRQGPELREIIPELHRRCLRRPGELERPGPLWERALRPFLTDEPESAHWLVVHRDRRGRLDGYVEWEPLERDLWHTKDSVIEVGDLYGVDDHVEGLLWQFLLDLDLVDVVKIECRPVDDPVRWRLADPRAFVVKEVWDEQWVRLVDVAAALAARTYQPSAAGAVVVEVRDPVLPDNDGRYEIAPDGARRVRRRPDLRLDVDALGAVYLGGTSVSELAAAGRVDELQRGAALKADLLLHHPLAPWSGLFF